MAYPDDDTTYSSTSSSSSSSGGGSSSGGSGGSGGSGESGNGPLDLSKYISGVTEQAYKDWGRGDDQYQWAKDQYAKDRGVTDQVTQRALDTQTKMGGWADEDRAFWKGTYKPAMEEQMAFARDYTTPGRMQANRGAAMAQSNLAFDTNANNAKSHLTSLGIDPASGRYAGLDAGLAAKRAMGAASAGTKSDRDTEMLGQEYLDRAIRTGASLPGQAVNEEGVGLAAGNQAVNAGLATTASGASTMGTGLQWNQQGNDMYKEWSKAAQAQTDAGLKANEQTMKREEAKSGESSGIGAAIGAGSGIMSSVASMAPMLMMMSDRSMKTDIQKVGDDGDTPMYAYRYKGDPKSYPKTVGPMAQDVEKKHPDRVAEVGGKLAIKYRAGGMVGEPEEYDRNPPRQMGKRPRLDREVDPVNRDPGEAREWREPLDTSEWDAEMPDSDTEHVLDPNDPSMSIQDQDERNRRQWVPNYADGGAVDDIPDYIAPYDPVRGYAEGGEVEDEDFADPMDEELPPEEPPYTGDVVPPEASPSGGAETDDVHALVNEGEFIIPKDVVRWHGEKFFQKLIQKAHDEMALPQEAEPEEPEEGPPSAMALAPPTFRSGGMAYGT